MTSRTNVPTPDGLAPLLVESADTVDWDDVADVLVVGFGLAGAVAALDTREQDPDADVLVIDRWEGGGASALSAGIFYAGGTRYQHEAGYDDNPDEMYRYLKLEVGDVVSDETVRRFADSSSDNLEWLGKYGVGFDSTLCAEKTSLPPEGKFLYFSGNEKVGRYASHARPAPRGHKVVGKNYTGDVLFETVRQAVDRSGTRTLAHAPARRLVVDRSDRVIGVEVCPIPEGRHREHQKLYQKVDPYRPMQNRRAEKAVAQAQSLESEVPERRLIRARAGVVLATGGFIYSVPMLRQYTDPNCSANVMALVRTGSAGCSGEGIRLGISAGGSTDHMGKIMLGRIIAPPTALLEGALVDKTGRRLINEDAYNGFMGDAISQAADAKAWLILDSVAVRKLLRQTVPSLDKHWIFFKLPNLANFLVGGTRRAKTLPALARKCGIDPDQLSAEMHDYNAATHAGTGDPRGKAAHHFPPIEKPPYYAINMALSNPLAPTLSFTLGGLSVDEGTGGVLRADGSAVEGLYAIGRAAVGICSSGYISGMALTDCVFSGRRAASALAAARKAAKTDA